MDWAALKSATGRGIKPGNSAREPFKLLRAALGMLAATTAGYLLGRPEAALLITVGAFLGTISAVIPHNRSRLVSVAATSAAQIAAAGLGMAFAGQWVVVLPLIFIAFFISGILRAVALSLSIRATVVAIVFLAFTEISSSLTLSWLEVIGYFALGFGFILLAQGVPPYGSRYSSQRRAVAALYRKISSGGESAEQLLAAERSLALIRPGRHGEHERLLQLVVLAERIAQLLCVMENRRNKAAVKWSAAARAQLQALADLVLRPQPATGEASWPGEPADGMELALVQRLDEARYAAQGGALPAEPARQEATTGLQLVRSELHCSSPILHHSLRLAVVCLIAQVAGLAVGRWLGPEQFLAGHGFWAVVAAALIIFPDYGSTFARGIGRTAGTAAGAVFGILLSMLPLTPLQHSVLLLLLFYGYLFFRQYGQPYTMFWVVAWIGSLTPGPLGSTTRALDTVVGCLLAFAAYLIAPTLQRTQLSGMLKQWGEATAAHLDALVLLWAADTEGHRSSVAQSEFTARATGLDFAEAARNAQLEPADRRGRWEAGAVQQASAAVSAARSSIAALSALAQGWSTAERLHFSAQLEESSRALVELEQQLAARSTAGTAQPASGDAAIALQELRSNSAALHRLLAQN